MEIKKVYRESIPKVKLIGKRYTNADRDSAGTFASYWQQAFQEGWFETLQQCAGIPNISEDYIGAMRMTGGDGGFEYWIGVLLDPAARVPEGFQAIEIEAGDLGVCWLYGDEKSGELYSMEATDMSMAALSEKGWRFSDKGWFLERYNNPRFTEPDGKGYVILDICAYLIADVS